MNKKFLSAILFGALMVSSTGTFVSCKDYDDDIDRIDTELSDLKSKLEALQTEVNNGNWVTNLVPAEGGFTVTFKDGKTYTIVSGKDGEKGDKGENGKGTDVKITSDGYWEIDGEKTEYVAVKKNQLGGNVKVPTVNAEGFWVFYDAEGNPQTSAYKANGAAYAVSANGLYTLYIPDAQGVMQTVKLPGAGSMISDIEFVGSLSASGGTTMEAIKPIEFHAYKPAATSNWKGNKPNLTGKEILTAYEPNVIVRITPNTVDAADLNLTLVNSKGDAAPVKVTLDAWDGKIGNSPVTRSASNNGMFKLALEGESLVPDKTVANWLNGNKNKYYFTSDVTTGSDQTSNCIAYALVEESGMVSPFEVTFNYKAASQTINAFYFVDLSNWSSNEATGVPTVAELEVGHTYRVITNDDSFLYDAYLEFTNAASLRWGIEYDKAASPMTFKVTQLPDKLTTANLEITMHYVTKAGAKVDNQKLTAKPKTTLTNGVALCAEKEYQRKKNNDFFVIPLNELWSALGTNKTADWVEDAKLALAINDFVIKEGNSTKVNTGVTLTYAKNANGDAAANTGEAKYLKIALANSGSSVCALPLNKSYVLTLNMPAGKGDYSGNVIATVTVPFKLTKPELNTILVKESGVFLSDNVATAYMYHGDQSTATVTMNNATYPVSNYKISRSFTDFTNKLDAVGMTYNFTLDGNTKIINNKKSSELATINSANNDPEIVLSVTNTDPNTGYPLGYKQNLIVKFEGNYLGIAEPSYKYEATYKYCVMSPIKEGQLIADGSLVKVSATGKTQITAANVWAKTYNGEVKYELFRVTEKNTTGSYESAWYRPDIKSVTFSSSNKNIFEMVQATPTDPEFDTANGKISKDSYIEVEGVAAGKAKLNADVLDIWGYSLKDAVDIEATVTPAN